MAYTAEFHLGHYTYFGRGYPHKASHWSGKHVGQPAVVLGNGESRLGFDLFRIRREIPNVVLLACNSYYADVFTGCVPAPDYLGAVDPHITQEILRSTYAQDYWFLCTVGNLSWIEHEQGSPIEPQAKLIEWDYNANFNCGVEMAQFAGLSGCDPIYLLGFDGPTVTSQVNNVYKGRPNCGATNRSPEPGLWQMTMVMKRWGAAYKQIGTNWLTMPTTSFEEMFA